MKRLLLFIVCVFLCSYAHAQAAKDTAERAEALRVAEVWLDSVQVYRHIPSIAAGVVVDQDLVWAKGFGTIDANHTVAAGPQTIYSICSIYIEAVYFGLAADAAVGDGQGVAGCPGDGDISAMGDAEAGRG